jgi:hypothetical protein
LWESKTYTPRGKILEQAIRKLSLNTISTGEPTYWLSAQEKTPDLLDFTIIKGLHKHHFVAQYCLDFTSDHSPVLIDFSSKAMYMNVTNHLYNSTNWVQFQKYLEAKINSNMPLNIPEQIELAVMNFVDIIQETSSITTKQVENNKNYLSFEAYILQEIKFKYKLKSNWQKHKTQLNECRLNAKITAI